MSIYVDIFLYLNVFFRGGGVLRDKKPYNYKENENCFLRSRCASEGDRWSDARGRGRDVSRGSSRSSYKGRGSEDGTQGQFIYSSSFQVLNL